MLTRADMKLFGPMWLILGVILNIQAFFMLWPLALASIHDTGDQLPFFFSAAITCGAGICALLLGRHAKAHNIAPRQVFLTTSAAWLGVSAFGCLPFLLIKQPLTLTNAFFESVSGVTTTGSTVLIGLDNMAPDLLLWRSLLQWMGGIGVIGMAVAVLPFLRVGGMRLFKTESSDWSEKATPRAHSLINAMVYCYLVLSLLCMVSYRLTGMDWFNAINHAMTTVSTGGYSTSDSSFGQFSNLASHWVAILFMLLGAMPFVLFVRWFMHGKFLLLHDSQVRGLLLIVAVTAIVLAIPIWREGDSALRAITASTFNLVSVITTCGYASTDYQLWGPLAVLVFFFCTFIGGCSGSTSGGLKIFRLQLLAGIVRVQFMTAIHPRAVIRHRYNNRLVSPEIISSSVAFILMMALSWVVISAILAATGLDLLTSITGAATALTNVGPGLGNIIGPAGNFEPLSDVAKWALSVGMLLGRLEFLTLLVIFSKAFWKN